MVSANFLIDSESNLKAALGTFGSPEQKPAAPQSAAAAPGQVHKGQGTVRAVDQQNGTVNISHDPIPSLNFPAMTMDFQVKDKTLLKGVKPGQAVEFDVVQQVPGELVLNRIAPTATQPVRRAPAGTAEHKGR